MLTKNYRYQLGALFLLTIVNLYYFFFKESLPDNALLITNSSDNLFSLSYIFSSAIAYFSYYIGPWVAIAFSLAVFTHITVISKRNEGKDYALPLLICFSTLFLSTLAFPSLVGSGLFQVVSKLINPYTIFLFFVIFTFLILFIVSDGNFIFAFKRIQHSLERVGFKLISKIASGFKKVKKAKVNLKALPVSSKATSILRKEKKQVDISAVKAVEEREEIKVSEPVVSETLVNDVKIEKKATKPAVKVKEGNTFFEAIDLIECISSENTAKVGNPSDDYFKAIISSIEEKLAEFKIQASIINVLKGPVVDTFELELGEGIKLSKVLGVSDDIGLALNGVPIRIVYPLRGKSTIGIEVPRNPREFIYLDEVLKSDSFKSSQYRLPIAMGKDAFGSVKVVDLAGMPHMLVAGATGAGKSVFINALLTSLVIKKSPQELKLILIDPKQLELATFQELPHLMLPVITDPKSSSIALLWLVQEMDRRYTVLKDMGVKNIEGFNRKLQNATPAQLSKIAQHYDGSITDYELPYIVCVIDEFADLILTKTGKEIETNVNRLAAKARAAGIHMVVATQRPSTDVVTGVIKANFPTRVAFRVTTGHDSKTILDQYGAEKLLGRGDMLYKHGVDLFRLHSSFVDEDEIEGLVQKLAEIPSEYDEQAVNFLDNGGDQDDSTQNGEVKTYLSGSTDDPVYDEAVQIVMQKGSASASMLQRALRVGYNRAANIIDEMERNGIVGPAQGSKPRKVLSRLE